LVILSRFFSMKEESASKQSSDEATRRDLLFVATAVTGAVGVSAACVPLIEQMNPDAATIAEGGPVDVGLSILISGRSSPAHRSLRSGGRGKFLWSFEQSKI
jgi:Rieske Fe-S protein